MTFSSVGFGGVSEIVRELSHAIDFDQDLPANLFVGEKYSFWLFERPLLDYEELFSGLISRSVTCYGGEVFVKFSGKQLLAESFFVFDGVNPEKDMLSFRAGFEDFWGGAVGYPVVIFNRHFDWVAYESAYEEFGVVAVREAELNPEFVEYLDLNFISKEVVVELAGGASPESAAAKVFLKSYFTKLNN
nr:hypothetical protein [uncultured Pseudomonas sp.]